MTRRPLASEAKHSQLARILADEIRAGIHKTGETIPSQNVLAERYGISVTTVREALSALEQQGLVRCVQGKGTFVIWEPNGERPVAREFIGLVTFNIAHPYSAEVVRRMQFSAQARGYSLLLSCHSRDASDAREEYQRMREHHVRGVLVGPLKGQEELREVLGGRPAPNDLVAFDCQGPVDAHCFVVDQTTGVLQAVEHLVSLGHRRICMLSAEEQVRPWNRRRGFEMAIDRFGLDPAECRTVHRPYLGFPDVAHRVTQELLGGDYRPTALLCHNDEGAFGVLRALREAGLRVPRDISVVGFDNVEVAQFAEVPLTTVDMRTHEIGELAVGLLHEAVQGLLQGGYRHVVVPSQLVVRDSTGPAP